MTVSSASSPRLSPGCLLNSAALRTEPEGKAASRPWDPGRPDGVPVAHAPEVPMKKLQISKDDAYVRLAAAAGTVLTIVAVVGAPKKFG